MDNITHSLIGVGLAQTGLSQKLGRGTTMILAVASNLPDVDVACLAGGPLAFLWRRTPTHSLLGTVALCLVASWIFRKVYSNLSWRAVIGLTALGIAGHVFADLWNSYGVVLYWPFSWRRVDLSWIFIIDLAIWGVLALSLITAVTARRYKTMIWKGGIGALVLYIGICAAAHQKSKHLLQDRINQEGLTIQSLFLYPEPFGPGNFRGVAHGADGFYEIFLIRPFHGEVQKLERLEAEEKSPLVEAARLTEAGRKLDWFFSTAVWRSAPDGQAALVYGLGFRTNVLKNRAPFHFRVTPDGVVSRASAPQHPA